MESAAVRVLLIGCFLVGISAGCSATHEPDDGGVIDGGDRDAPPIDAFVPPVDAHVDEPDASDPTHAAPGEVCTTPGMIERVACGLCGTVERFCAASGEWSYGACEDEGVCAPGTVGEVACGNCGTQSARCTTACEWDVTGTCAGEGICAPGTRTRDGVGCPPGQTHEQVCDELCSYTPVGACTTASCPSAGAIETIACGMCGTMERFCTTALVWEYSACRGEHGCVPGTTSSIACGMCGTATARCNDSCALVAGACMGEGTCSPGATMNTGDGCPAGQTRQLTCSSSCGYVETRACAVPGCGTGPGCGPGTQCCDGTCVDVSTSMAHCGSCGDPCERSLSDRCVGGSCQCGSGPQCIVSCSLGTCFPI